MMMQIQITAQPRVYSILNVPVENTYAGTSRNRHDLAALAADLRCHDGLTKQDAPFIVSRVIDTLHFEALPFATTATAH